MRRCGLCNRPLRDRESVQLGFGPACWARLSEAAAGGGHRAPPTRGLRVVEADPASPGERARVAAIRPPVRQAAPRS